MIYLQLILSLVIMTLGMFLAWQSLSLYKLSELKK
jgi:hypothetical protein